MLFNIRIVYGVTKPLKLICQSVFTISLILCHKIRYCFCGTFCFIFNSIA